MSKAWLLRWFDSVKFLRETSFFSPSVDIRSEYILPFRYSSIANLKSLFIVGWNPRFELPLLNIRFREQVKNGNLAIYCLGIACDLTYRNTQLGLSIIDTLKKLYYAKYPFLKRMLCQSKSYLLLGSGILNILDNAKLYRALLQIEICNKSNIIIGSVFSNLTDITTSEIGWVSKNIGEDSTLIENTVHWIFSLGSDNFLLKKNIDEIVVYFGHHGDRMVQVADYVFPSPVPTEKEGLIVNMEGRYQIASFATIPEGRDIRTEWSHFAALDKLFFWGMLKNGFWTISQKELSFLQDANKGFEKNHSYFSFFSSAIKLSARIGNRRIPDTLFDIRRYLFDTVPYGRVMADWRWDIPQNKLLKFNSFIMPPSIIRSSLVTFNKYILSLPRFFKASKVENYYLTDSILRSSHIMALTAKRIEFGGNFKL